MKNIHWQSIFLSFSLITVASVVHSIGMALVFIVTLVLPVLSSIFYLLFAYITDNTGTWDKFIELNTISDGNVTVEISQSLLDINQITFMLLVYWGTMIIQYVILKRKNSVYVEGRNYA